MLATFDVHVLRHYSCKVSMKLLIITTLVAICTAARVPNPPKIPESFCGNGEIEFHGAKRTDFGNFVICRDQIAQKEVESATYENTIINETYAALLRYDLSPEHMAYYIRGTIGKEHCILNKINMTSKLPPFFDWVRIAVYEGEVTIREMSYDFWALSVADVRFELAVSKEDPNTPVYYNRKETEDFVKYSFKSFDASTPDPKFFEIPDECKEP